MPRAQHLPPSCLASPAASIYKHEYQVTSGFLPCSRTARSQFLVSLFVTKRDLQQGNNPTFQFVRLSCKKENRA